MNTINATPPENFPAQVIMLDQRIAARHPSEGFYLRVSDRLAGTVDAIRLTGAVTLPDARKLAIAKGYAPSHWMDVHLCAPLAF